MAGNVRIRQISAGDAVITGYRDLRIQLWPDCRDVCDREIAAILQDSIRWAVFAAVLDGGALAGFLEVRLRDCAEGAESSPVAYLEGWFVREEHRRQGLGRALVIAAERWAAGRGCSEIASDTNPDNRVSRTAHGRLGYKEVEELVCFLKRLDDAENL